MKNGDRVTGSIVKKDATSLTIKSVHFGTVTLPWAQIDSVKSDAPLTVVLPDKKTVQGTIASQGDKILVKEKAAEETVAPKDIVALRNADEEKAYLRMLRPRLTDLWSVTGTIGLAGAYGNSTTHTFTIPITFVRATNDDKITAHFNYIRSAATVTGVSSQTADAIRGGWAYNRNINKKLFGTLVNEYEFDKFQDLDLRAVAGVGLGWHAGKDEKRKQFLDLTAGLDYNHEAFSASSTSPAFTRRLGEFYWGNNAGLQLTKRFSLTESYRMFNELGNSTLRQTLDSALSAPLTKHFTWNASVSDHYLTNPPVGLKKNDFLYSTGFGFKFAP